MVTARQTRRQTSSNRLQSQTARRSFGTDGASTFGDLSDVIDMVEQNYFGRLNDTNDSQRWTTRGSATLDDSLEMNLETLREHSNQLYREHAHALAAVGAVVDNVVGTGLWPEPLVLPLPGVITPELAATINQQLKGIYRGLLPRIGTSGLRSLWECQRLVERCLKRDGEAFVLFSRVERAGKPIPLQVDHIEAERVAQPIAGCEVTWPDGTKTRYQLNERITLADGSVETAMALDRMGVRRTIRGEVLGYFVSTTEPLTGKVRFEFFTPARLKHLFDQHYPNQRRGLPWFFGVLDLARDNQDYAEAVRVAAMVAACLHAYMKTPNATKLKVGRDGYMKLKPGVMPVIDVKDEINSVQTTQPHATLAMFNSENLHAFAAALGLPYHHLTGNLVQSSYNGLKMGENRAATPTAVDQQLIDDRLLGPLHEEVVTQAVLAGRCAITPRVFVKHREHLTWHRWKRPAQKLLDPHRELPALAAARRDNSIPISYIHDLLGVDTEVVVYENARFANLERKNGIVPPSQLTALGQYYGMAEPADGTAPDRPAYEYGNDEIDLADIDMPGALNGGGV